MEGQAGGVTGPTRAPAPVVAAAVSLAWGMVVSIAAYAVVRAIQFFVYPDPNPATLVWSAHAGYFWRAWTVAYAGGIGAFIAFPVVRARIEPATRALAVAVGVATGAIALQTALLP
jgi:hypothetical protein